MAHRHIPKKTSNLLPVVGASLPPGTFELLKAIAWKATETDMPLYLVGGSVRDILLATPVKDLDMVVEGDAAVFAFEVANELGGDVLTYSQFGTATVKLQGQRFDLATARQETYLRPGALPSVTPSTIQQDLGRRDFSINSLAIALAGPESGRLLDPFGYGEDLELGLIRVLHPGSFIDDPTRILRAVRYEQRLNFRLEADTHRLLLEAVEGGLLDAVSGARIRRELEPMFQEERPYLPISRSGELGVLRAIHPSLGNGFQVKEKMGHGTKNSPLEYLAALAYRLSVEESEAFIHRLRLPSRWAKVVRDTIAVRLMSGIEGASGLVLGKLGVTLSHLCSVLDQFSPVSVRVNALLSESVENSQALECYLTALRHVKPALNGRDLISLGVAQGPPVGELMRQLRNARIDGSIATREEEMQLVKEYVSMKQLS